MARAAVYIVQHELALKATVGINIYPKLCPCVVCVSVVSAYIACDNGTCISLEGSNQYGNCIFWVTARTRVEIERFHHASIIHVITNLQLLRHKYLDSCLCIDGMHDDVMVKNKFTLFNVIFRSRSISLIEINRGDRFPCRERSREKKYGFLYRIQLRIICRHNYRFSCTLEATYKPYRTVAVAAGAEAAETTT